MFPFINKVLMTALCVVSMPAFAFEFQYPRSTVEMALQQVSPHVYFVQGQAGVATDNQGFISNASVIISENSITVVDALGSPSLAEQLLSLIREVSDKPIKRLIVTHYHADHIYGMQVFEDLGSQILAPFGATDYLNSATASERLEERRFSLDPWVNETTRLVYADQWLTESTVIQQDELKLSINMLGKAHSDADLSVYVEPDGVLISGDVIFEGRIPFLGDSDSKLWLETLERMLSDSQGLKALVPGHGGLASEPKQAVGLTLDYLAFMREQMGQGVEEMLSFDEIYSAIDWSRFEKLPAFGLGNRINAYQVYLSMEQELLEE